ncbi:protein DEHYDRATION-INDUCED 19-like [Telopea speciosissima]|uniref:protein DEHYDRATION-INDUCED 19-like n=1 Tax=Telopea speciosissima TaxID=54955 RepID=UPI001CC534CE|nr:protein DEHYDRATION-INDUCED 19-like [Telopea speciosissima]
MDSDLWTSRLAAAKRQYALQHHQNSQLDRLSIDDFEVEEEVRPDFPCPYCYEDYDIASLCSHLEDEHPFESKVSVCPICSVKVSRDMLNHITLQHGHLFKLQRRRRLRRVAIPNSQTLSLLGRDLREAHLQVLLGGGGYRSSNATASNAVTDSFLSSLVLNFPSSEADEISKSAVSSAEDISVKNVTSTPSWKSSFDSSLSYEEREQKIKQATIRAGFVQDLLLSTLFGD